MSSLRSGKSFLGRSTIRTYMTPSEKLKHYISQFIKKIREGDPECKVYSSGELAELAQDLYETLTTTPWFYDLVRKVVDEGVFLDSKTKAKLEQIKTVKVTEEEVASAKKELELQNEMKRLIQFAEKTPNVHRGIERSTEEERNEFNIVKSQIDTLYAYHYGAKGVEKESAMHETMAELAPLVEAAIQRVRTEWNQLQARLEKRILDLTVDYTAANSMQNVDEFVEQDLEMARICHEMQVLLSDSITWLAGVESILQKCQDYFSAREDLRRLYQWVGAMAKCSSKDDQANSGEKTDHQSYQSSMRFLESTAGKLSFAPMIDSLQSITTSLAVLNHKLAQLTREE